MLCLENKGGTITDEAHGDNVEPNRRWRGVDNSQERGISHMHPSFTLLLFKANTEQFIWLSKLRFDEGKKCRNRRR